MSRRIESAAISLDAASEAQAAGVEAAVLERRDVGALSVIVQFSEALVVALFVELALALANVAAQAYFQHSFLWADEIAKRRYGLCVWRMSWIAESF
jgi:hypothetical protein